MARLRTQQDPNRAWPGYVDVLSTLLMVVVFVLVFYMLAQLVLANAITGKDKALEALNRQIAELTSLLSLEQSANTELRANVAQLSASLRDSTAARDRLEARLGELARSAEDNAARNDPGRIVILQTQLDEAKAKLAAAEADIAGMKDKLTSSAGMLDAERKLSDAARSQVDLLNKQMLALREQLAALQKALEASEAKDKDQQVQIADLGKRLNVALARKVEELARYRSEFFGRLREALGNRRDVQIVGDRFVFQSEVLFDSGSADLNAAGREQMKKLAKTLLDVAKTIPSDLPWILRIDGHTDAVPIKTAQFPSNWELSAARAITVAKFLIAEGVPAQRIAATGFGEFQPIDDRTDEIGYRRNRRIEIKLTER